MKKSAIAIITLLLISACNTLDMTYRCNPAGATLYDENNKRVGSCPITLEYDVTKLDRQNGYMTLRGMTANWISGASLSVPSITANLQNGLNQNFSFDRPQNIPGYDIDANYAMKLEQQRQQQQLQSDMQTLQLLQIYQGMQPSPVIISPTQTNCVRTGNTVNCQSY